MATTTDERIRRLEQAANEGDEHAKQQLEHMKSRILEGLWDRYIGRWVLSHGVRLHFRGKLQEVVERNGKIHFVLGPCSEIGEFGKDGVREERFFASEEEPFVLYDGGLGLSIQPKSWSTPKKPKLE